MTSKEIQLLRKLTDEQRKRFHSIARLILDAIGTYQANLGKNEPGIPFIVLHMALGHVRIDADVLNFMLAVLLDIGCVRDTNPRSRLYFGRYCSLTGNPYDESLIPGAEVTHDA